MKRSDYYLPAEWEPQSGILLTWPHEGTDWKPYLEEITKTYLSLAQAITRHEHLIIAAQEEERVKQLLEQTLSADQMGNVTVYHCENNDTWARDHGALTLMSKQPASFGDKAILLDFKFNGWGEKFAWEKDNAITYTLFNRGAFCATLERHDDFVLEGGSVESDGKGTVMTTDFCLLADNRNQPLSQEDIEQRLKQYLNEERVVWLHHGKLIGDDTDGHIDTIVRLCPDDTILYVGCDDENDAQFADFQQLEQELQHIKTQQGMPYRLLRLPMPDPIFYDGDRLPATYANFLIINGAVIVPTYGQPQKDKMALHTIGKAFPDREIIGVDASVIVRQHGSIHCLTMQFPQGVLA